MTATSQPPGWYPDPQGRFASRYFDGQAWTATVQDHSGWTGHESQAPAAHPTTPPSTPVTPPAATAPEPGTAGPADAAGPAGAASPASAASTAGPAGSAPSTDDTTGAGASPDPTAARAQDDTPATQDSANGAGGTDEAGQTELIPATPAQATPAQTAGPAAPQGVGPVPPAPTAAVPPAGPQQVTQPQMAPGQPYPPVPPQFPAPGYPQQAGYPGGAYPPPQQGWAPAAPPPYPGQAAPGAVFGPGPGLVLVLLGAIGLVLSYFALDWVDDGSFLDLRKFVDAFSIEIDDVMIETYFEFVAFVVAALAIVLTGLVALGIRSRTVAYLMFGRLGVVFWEKGGRGIQVMPAVFSLACAGLHLYVLIKLYGDQGEVSDAKVGAWIALAGYVVLALGAAIGPRRIQPNYGGYPGGGYPPQGAPGGYGYPPAGGHPGGYQAGGYQGGGYQGGGYGPG